jgi:O-antigen/teichoic acid export membrane protein
VSDDPAAGKAGRGRRRGKEQHPGGAGAALGIRLLRFSGVQGSTLLVGNVMQMVSVVVVAAYLGPDDMGRFALLQFLASLTTQVLSLPSKPGTIMRTFGGGDDEADDDADEDVSADPRRTLGTGLIWTFMLALVGIALLVVFRRPVADLLLGTPDNANLVFWAALLSATSLIYKLASIMLWLERRPALFLACDIARPGFGLILVWALLASGSGLDGAIIGTTVGTVMAAVLALFFLRGSYEPVFDLGELKHIIVKGKTRAPIVLSFWTLQNADSFLLSRFVDHSQVGIYRLASQLGFVVSFFPQGFRLALRPLRKSAAFEAVREQYGRSVAMGQLLGYFTLVSIFAVLAMVLGADVLVDAAPVSYAAAAGVIPLCAAAFVMPALYRTVNQTASVNNQRQLFIAGSVGGAALYIGVTIALAPSIGIYAPPIGMLVGLGLPVLYIFARGQRGKKPIQFPYREVLRALLAAAVIAVAFQFLPEMSELVELGIALALLALYLGLLIVLRVVPENHWQPLLHMVRSVGRGTPMKLNPRRGLRQLDPVERDQLRVAVIRGLPAERLAPEDEDGNATGEGEGLTLVALLRRVGEEAGAPVGDATPQDRVISLFLFEAVPAAVRDQTMDRLLEAGVGANDLRALEELVTKLAQAPDGAWEGQSGGRRRRIPRPRRSRRRRAKSLPG